MKADNNCKISTAKFSCIFVSLVTCISDLGYYVPRQDKLSNQNKHRLREISTSDPDRLIDHVEGVLRER